MIGAVYKESLQCLLTQDERLIKGEELAQLMATQDKLEAERKAFSDGIKLKLTDAEELARKLGQQLREGKEWRDIDCREAPDYEHGQVDTIREDTGEVIRSRRMRPEERQQPMHYADGTSCTPPVTPKGKRLRGRNKDDDAEDDGDPFKTGLQ